MVNYVAIGVIAVVIVLLVIYALDRWNVFGDDRENPESGTERIQQEARRSGDYSVSWLKKHKTLTLPAKVVVLAIGGIIISTGVYVYFTFKAGAPAEVPYANAIQAAVIAITGILGGVTYRAKKDRDRGRLDVIYEDEGGDEDGTETIWYGKSESTTNKDGNKIVYEHFPTRILGLFGRRKLVAHDRELRSRRTVLSDRVAHEIPTHAVRVAEDHYVIRTQAQETTEGVSNAADYRYRSPIEMPYESYLQQKEKIEKYKLRLQTKDAKLGEAQSLLADLQRRMKSNERFSRTEAREEIMELLRELPTMNKSVEVRQDRRRERLPKDQRDARGNGVEADS